jgi:signal peptidase
MKAADTSNSKKTTREIVGWIRFFLILVAVFGSGYLLFNYVPFFSRMQHYVIMTGSMDPVIAIDDVVVVDTTVPPEELEIGDIIAFRATVSGSEIVVVHYVADIQIDGEGVRTFRTKPEISDEWDDWVLSDADIVGRLLFIVPAVGNLLRFIESPFGKIVLVADLVVIAVIVDYLGKRKRKKTEA